MEKYIFFSGSRVKNLKGKIFGHLIPQKIVEIKNRYAVWECECDLCGGKRNVSSKYLVQGQITMCRNCAENSRKEALRKSGYDPNVANHLDLAGKTFGFWTVLMKGEYRNGTQFWVCKCKCGTVREVSVYRLVNGQGISCGCSVSYNLLGKKIGMLKVVSLTRKNGKLACKCKCDCGNEVIYTASELHTRRSCGCMKEVEEEGHTKLTWVVNGGQTLRANNTSGVRGVSRVNGKWGARITFQRKSYWLGAFLDFNDAVNARKEAEKHLYGDFLEWYNNRCAKKSNEELFVKLYEAHTQEKDQRFIKRVEEIYRKKQAGEAVVVGSSDYSFLSMQKYRYGEISTWKRQLLDQVGILDLIGNNRSFERKLEKAQKYYVVFGNLRVPPKYVCDDGFALGQWIMNLRSIYNGNTPGLLDKKRIQQLESIGIEWRIKDNLTWEEWYELAEEYFNSNFPHQ